MKLNLFKPRDKRPNPTTPSQPIEVGTVDWIRSLDQALAEAGRTSKPVFALFQEVPGCAGCKQFGADVLSNPVVVAAIEREFVPLLIHNNTPGPDAEVLAAYGEPAWNYQVVRFLDASGADIIERRDRVWETGALIARMVHTLAATQSPVPKYLRLLEQEHSDRLRTADVVQACFWVGEMELGQIDGVVTTQAGFTDGHEVTRIEFDPHVTTLPAIVEQASRRGVATAVYSDHDGVAELRAAKSSVPAALVSTFKAAPARDQKRQISGRSKPAGLSPAQLTKLNAFVQDPATAATYLGPGASADR